MSYKIFLTSRNFFSSVLFMSMNIFTHEITAAPLSPDAALERLMDGNHRFVNDKLMHPARTHLRREATVSRQRPFAIVLGCADSRIPPEIVFDQGIGDIFVVRVAGNVLGSIVLDSIEFSVLNNDSSIILVLGHENCGAITAVLEKNTKDIEAIAELIEPAIQNVQRSTEHTMENAVKANVNAVTDQLKRTPVIARFLKDGKLKVFGGYYNLSSGKVDIINP